MAKLNADEKKLLAELQARENEPDNDDDFEIEIYKDNHGARVPYSKGRKFLQEIFGIDLDDTSDAESDDGEGSKAPESSPSSGYFSRRR